MKIIFLDVDGVLNYCTYKNNSTPNIDHTRVALLKKIIDCTNAKIVLSSTWRQCHDKDTGIKEPMYLDLEKVLSTYGLNIYEDLPQLNLDECNSISTNEFSLGEPFDDQNNHKDFGTGYDISEYIKTHSISSYVILDDLDWNFDRYGLKQHWIQPCYWDEDGGLQEEHVEKAIKILNNSLTK